jgi:ADP-ribosylglycohydrolase
MFAAAAIACAAVTDDVEQILLGALSQVPTTSRLWSAVMNVIEKYRRGVTAEEFFADLHARWDEFNTHDWCHTISNAEIVAAAMLYCRGDFAKSICMAVEQGFDTDCNGATIGSILGMRNGFASLDSYWLEPLHGKLKTSIFGVDTVEIEALVEKTMTHVSE